MTPFSNERNFCLSLNRRSVSLLMKDQSEDIESTLVEVIYHHMLVTRIHFYFDGCFTTLSPLSVLSLTTESRSEFKKGKTSEKKTPAHGRTVMAHASVGLPWLGNPTLVFPFLSQISACFFKLSLLSVLNSSVVSLAHNTYTHTFLCRIWFHAPVIIRLSGVESFARAGSADELYMTFFPAC